MRRLWAAGLISELGDWAARLALTVLVYRQGGGAFGVAMVAVISMVPWIGIGQVLATLADRFSHRDVMVICNALRAVCFGSLGLLHLPVWTVLAVTLIAALGEPPFEAAKGAAVTQLAGDSLGAVLMLVNTTRQVAILAGYGLGGITLAVASPQVALGANALSFALSAALVASLPSTRSSEPGNVEDRGTRGLMIEGARALWQDPMVRMAAVVVNVGAFSGLAAESMVVVYSAHLGHPSGVATGLLATVMPITAILAAPFWPTSGPHDRLLRIVIRVNLVCSGFAALFFLLDPGLPVAVVSYGCFGVLEVVTVTAGVVVMTRLPQATRGSSMGFLSGFLMIMQLSGAAVAGILAGRLGIATALAVCSAPGVGISLWAYLMLRRLPHAIRQDPIHVI